MALERDSFDPLRTERLVLRVLDGRGAQPVQEYYERNRDYLKPWEPWRSPEFYTRKFQEEDLQIQFELIRKGEMFKVWLFKNEDLNYQKVIGLVSLNNIQGGTCQGAYLGYGMDHNEVNKGYMTEAAAAVCDYAFNVLNLQRLEAHVLPHNKASFRVAEKLGFSREADCGKFLQIDGIWQEHVRMVRLKPY